MSFKKLVCHGSLALLAYSGLAYANNVTTGGGCNNSGCWADGQQTSGGGSTSGGYSHIQYSSSGGSGPGQAEQPPDTLLGNDEYCPLTPESSKDALARAIAIAIGQLDQTLEHGAFIVRDSSGSLSATPINTGGTNSINPAEAIGVLRAAGYNESHVVGFIHYHTPGNDDRNRAPSWDGQLNNSWANPGENDYAFSARISRGAVDDYGADADTFNAEFTNYIIASDGTVYEWDGVAPHNAVQDQTISDSEAELANRDAQSKC